MYLNEVKLIVNDLPAAPILYDDLSAEDQRAIDLESAEENRAAGEMSRAEIDAERFQDATDTIHQEVFAKGLNPCI